MSPTTTEIPLQAPTSPRWLSVQQAATHCNVSVTTIHRWASQRLVTRHRVPGCRVTRFDLHELDRVMSGSSPSPTTTTETQP